MLLVDEGDDLSVLTLKQERPELDLTSLKENVGLVNTAYYEEVLSDVFRWNSEDPVGLVLADVVWGVLKHHLCLLTAQD